MAVVIISLPNLATEEALIASTIATIEGNAIDTLYTFIKPRFIFKGSEDCSTFYLDDVTDYQEVSVVDTDNVSMNVTYIYKTSCGDIIDCSAVPFGVNSRLTFQNTYGDGEYCVSIEMIYSIPDIDPELPPTVYTTTVEECLTQDCCNNKIIDLRVNISNCMSETACSVDSNKDIGKSTVKLMSKYLKMSNLLWLLDHTKQGCDSYEGLACIFKSI